MMDLVQSSGLELVRALEDTLVNEEKVILDIAAVVSGALKSGRKVLLCGNGGSAADCQHLAAEFVNRFRMERRPLAAIALTTDSSIITAISNDYSFNQVFEKQVRALGRPGDVLLGISTSGKSENVLVALDAARSVGMETVGFCGRDGRKMKELCHHLVRVHSSDTPRIQEVHIFLGHVICDIVERMIFEYGLS